MLTNAVREVVLDAAREAPPGTAVLLSGGVDSQVVFRALRELDRDPIAVSFTLEGRESRDFRLAREAAREAGVEFIPITLSRDLTRLREYVEWAVSWGLRSKTGIECFWPRKVTLDALAGRVPAVATGDGGDGYFCVSKRGILHFTETVGLTDEFRRAYFAKPDWAQNESIRRYAADLGIGVHMPLADPRLLNLFLGRSWREVNRPRQKQPLRDAFDLTRLPPHMNLQLGDSGIADLFTGLVEDGSPVRLYNSLIREATSSQEALF